MIKASIGFSLLFLVLLSQPSLAQSSGTRGGGDAVVCGKEVTFYDLVEGRNLKAKFNFGPVGDYRAKLAFAVSEIARLNPTRAKRYSEQIQKFENEAQWIEGDLIDVPDTGIGYIPRGCALKQMAIQNPSVSALYPDKRYLIDKQLWNMADENSKAALVLHEVIYTEYGTGESSLPVRLLNEFVWSDRMKNASLQEYLTVGLKVFQTFDDQSGFLCGENRGGTTFLNPNVVAFCSVYGANQTSKVIFSGQLFGVEILYRVRKSSYYTLKYLNNGDPDLADYNTNIGFDLIVEKIDGAKDFTGPWSQELKLDNQLTLHLQELQTKVSEQTPLIITSYGVDKSNGVVSFELGSKSVKPSASIQIKTAGGETVSGDCTEVSAASVNAGLRCEKGLIRYERPNFRIVESEGGSVGYYAGELFSPTCNAKYRVNEPETGWLEISMTKAKYGYGYSCALTGDTVLAYYARDNYNHIVEQFPAGFKFPLGRWKKSYYPPEELVRKAKFLNEDLEKIKVHPIFSRYKYSEITQTHGVVKADKSVWVDKNNRIHIDY